MHLVSVAVQSDELQQSSTLSQDNSPPLSWYSSFSMASMAPDVPIYHYGPLHREQIRLISLDPDERSIPAIHLRHGNIDSEEYEAISYTWDNQQCDIPIMCDGCSLLVTRNCIRLLKRLAHRKCTSFWIDAICIDQNSPNATADKAAQLPLMGKIYQKATCVISWLGESSFATMQVFRYWQQVYDTIEPWRSGLAIGNGIWTNLPTRIQQQIQEQRVRFNGIMPGFV